MPALQTIQLIGIVSTLSYALARAATRSGFAAFHRYAIVSVARDAVPAMPAGWRVETMTPDALSRHSIDVGPAEQARRFADGLTCLGAFNRRDVLTGVIWLAQGAYREEEVDVDFLLPPGACWDTGLWVAPQHRLGRSFPALWAGVAQWMQARGIDQSISRITDYNIASILAHRRMRAKTLSHHSFLRIGNWQYSSDTRPRLSRRLTAPDAPRPVVDLRTIAAVAV